MFDAKGEADELEKELIEHCASLAVSYMQEQVLWTGTVEACGYLRDAIVTGDHSDFLADRRPTAEPAKDVFDYTKMRSEDLACEIHRWQKDETGQFGYICKYNLAEIAGMLDKWRTAKESDLQRYFDAECILRREVQARAEAAEAELAVLKASGGKV